MTMCLVNYKTGIRVPFVPVSSDAKDAEVTVSGRRRATALLRSL